VSYSRNIATHSPIWKFLL